MPAKLSKFVIPASCKDYAHPWSDSCISTTAGLGLHALQESLRIYSTVYFITLLLRGKIPSKNDIKRTILSILQSTAFLSWSAFTFSMFICSIRQILGKFNILTVSFIPSFLSSFAAIILERPSRRPMLCLYVSNIATEALFRMAVWRGYISPVPYGQVYIFALSMAILLYFFRSEKNKDDSIFRIIRILVGPYEEAKYLKRQSQLERSQVQMSNDHKDEREGSDKKGDDKSRRNGLFSIIWKALNVYKLLIDKLKAKSKHVSCPHSNSCVHYVLTGSAKLFSYGLCAQLALKIVFKLRSLIKKPRLLKATIFKKDNLNLALSLGGFSGLYKLMSCSLRRFYGYDSQYHAIPAGLIASISFVMYPDITIALYVMWKALQILWNDGVERGKVPEVKWFVIFLYCFSTAVLFHVAIMEPHNLRATYWKFLINLSGGRIATMSRLPLDEFGLETSKALQEVLRKTNTTDQYNYSF
ncbi:transmembrane protein 135-like isoform X2 [Belonocnema kinseyi]|uniref:transmembrane protein 135-like isoform X2 n=1 Tax=Belonocnema kinseyi TaxID=2817044 RepID=UPI00143D62F0|nr:transmembrane protein 135-like isoform X2 [Belonocnema kinseyi]XP_033226285.1 transmembrane protein 135-like isoform X2 [Belonocnema kinseyi]